MKRVLARVSSLFLLALVGWWAGCGTNSTGCQNCSGSVGTTIDHVKSIYLGVSHGERVLASYTVDDGTVVRYHGTQTTAGLPDGIEEISVTTAAGALSRIQLDAQGHPVVVTGPTVGTFNYDWSVTGQLAISVVAPGGERGTIYINPDTGATVTPVLPDVPAKAATMAPVVRRVPAAASRQTSPVTVTVTRNGRPFDPPPPEHAPTLSPVGVHLDAPGVLSDRFGDFSAQRLGVGSYEVQLPNAAVGVLPTAREWLTALGRGQQAACMFFDKVSPAQCTGFAALPGAGPAIAAACARVVPLLKYGCFLLKASGSGTLLDAMITKVKDVINWGLDSMGTQELLFTPYAQEWNQYSYRNNFGTVIRATVSPAGLQLKGALAVNITTTPSIYISLIPPSPAVGQAYVAEARFSAVPAGGVARLAIVNRNTGLVVTSTTSTAEDGKLQLRRTLGAANSHRADATITSGGETIATDSHNY